MLLERGWRPRRDIDDFVFWVPRKHNQTADWLANIALQTREDFTWIDHDFQFGGDKVQSFLIMSDGGFKPRVNVGAAAFVFSL